ncbi:hypothetical protein C8J56DRAFT_1064119 [Mycena floridula]|nr:hypothetical protein C8J56DRAFT_1064119 [Mycena floridula]
MGAHRYNVRFGEVSAAEAARGYNNKPKGRPENLNARSLGTDINWNALKLTENQRKDIHTIYQNGRNVDHKFYAYGDLAAESQREAAALLASYGLDLDSRDEPANRWSVKWSMKSPGQNTVPTRRVLSQCDCGYECPCASSSSLPSKRCRIRPFGKGVPEINKKTARTYLPM